MAKLDLSDFVKYGKLFEVYGKLLSEDRQAVMSMYFDYNMTLAEIANEKAVSRQAILDSIEKSCLKLETYEKALGVFEKQKTLSEALAEIVDLAKRRKQSEIVEKLEKLLKEM
ncbi:MAG: hypothetical protein IJ817_00900 [Clostridia bacterium]|nr:hypothetical protein [Clostridia bacterium]